MSEPCGCSSGDPRACLVARYDARMLLDLERCCCPCHPRDGLTGAQQAALADAYARGSFVGCLVDDAA